MLHENDPAKHGCEFGVFFDGRTPPELLKEGIYTALALALYPDDFQATSFSLAALVLGASESGVWSRFKARVIEKISRRKWIFFPKKDNVAPKESTPLDLTVNALQAAKAWKGRAFVRQRSTSDTRAGTSDVLQAADAAPPSQTAAAEPTIVELPTSASITTIAPARTSEDLEAAERRRAVSWLARQDELSRSDEDLLAHRAVLLEAEVHWKSDATFYKPTKVQLLAEAGHDRLGVADAEAGAPPWSILMVHSKARPQSVPYEEVTAVRVNEKNLELVVEHTRKLNNRRSERLHRQCLRMRTRPDFLLWRDALRPTMASTSGASTSRGDQPE
jgi:hypothetical protein